MPQEPPLQPLLPGKRGAGLIVSVHEVMTSFINEKLDHRTQMDDRRSRIDRQYMGNLAARLLQS